MSKRDHLPLSQKIAEAMDIPVGIFGKVSFTEGIGRRELHIDGCVGLVGYTEEKVILNLCDCRITVGGQFLSLHSFSGGRCVVSGRIDSVIYSDGEGESLS